MKAAAEGLVLKSSAVRKVVDALAVRDEEAPVVTDNKSNPEPDTDLRDNENVPLPPGPLTFEPDPSDRLASEAYRQAVDDYIDTEVLPWVPDAWVDHTKTKLGYEIPFTREFYVYTPPRPLTEIDADIEKLEAEILDMLGQIRS